MKVPRSLSSLKKHRRLLKKCSSYEVLSFYPRTSLRSAAACQSRPNIQHRAHLWLWPLFIRPSIKRSISSERQASLDGLRTPPQSSAELADEMHSRPGGKTRDTVLTTCTTGFHFGASGAFESSPLLEECHNRRKSKKQELIKLTLALECCRPNTARKPWEALITRLPPRALKAIFLAAPPSLCSTCVPNKGEGGRRGGGCSPCRPALTQSEQGSTRDGVLEGKRPGVTTGADAKRC